MTEKNPEQQNLGQGDELAGKRIEKAVQAEAERKKIEAAEKEPGFVERVIGFVEEELREVQAKLDGYRGKQAEVFDISMARDGKEKKED